MLDAEITRIRECESKADELQRKAKNESKRILDDARMEAERIIKDAEDNARKIHDRLVDEGRIEASAAYDSYMDSIRQECVALADQAKQSEDEAIEMIGLDTVKEDLISDLMEIGVVEITDTGNSISENESADHALIKDGAEERVSTLDLHISRV